MSEHAKAKVTRFNEKLDEIAVLTAEMEAEEGKNDTLENREKLQALLVEGETLRKSIEQDNTILGLKSFMTEPANAPKAYPQGGDGVISQPFQGIKSLGDQFIESEAYKASIVEGKINQGLYAGMDAKGFLTPQGVKATFDTTSTGLDSSRNYVPGVVLIEQQRLTVRDLLPVGQTTQNIIYFIKESSFTNAADMVAEEGEKPEATLATTTANAPVKKIAVVLKVTDEMYADFPQLRDYINTRLRFMVEAKEEQQLLNGTGAGNQITGILNSSPQTQALGGDTVPDAIHKAMTKIRVPASNVGGYEPSGLVIHPNDWQAVRLTKDLNNQYYGGGPFTGAYGAGGIARDMLWGLPVVITTAIAENTALVGDFRRGAQIWQREGIRVESTNANEDDFNFNRVSIRIEERLALTVYRPSAFCTVTGI